VLSREEVQAVVDRIVARARPQKVVVFGSYAKGTATGTSDLDILLVKETELPMARRAEELAPVVSRRWLSIDIHVYTPDEVEEYGKDQFGFVRSALTTGRVVFEQIPS